MATLNILRRNKTTQSPDVHLFQSTNLLRPKYQLKGMNINRTPIRCKNVVRVWHPQKREQNFIEQIEWGLLPRAHPYTQGFYCCSI